MAHLIPEADLVAVRPEADVPGARLSLGALSWAVFEGARDPYVILVIIYIFMPYVGSVMVGYPHANPTQGQEVISQWSQYAGWATMATAPFLGASIDQLGRRKGWLTLCVAVMAPLMFALWWARPDGTALPVVAGDGDHHGHRHPVRLHRGAAQFAAGAGGRASAGRTRLRAWPWRSATPSPWFCSASRPGPSSCRARSTGASCRRPRCSA